MSEIDNSRPKRAKTKEARRLRALEKFFDAPCLLRSESQRQYSALHDTLQSEMPPQSVMDRIHIRSIADSVFEVKRTARLGVAAIEGALVEALANLLQPHLRNSKKQREIAINYLEGSDEDREKAVRYVRKRGINISMIEACAMDSTGKYLETLEKLRGHREQTIDRAERKLVKSARLHARKLQNEDKRKRSDTREKFNVVNVDKWK